MADQWRVRCKKCGHEFNSMAFDPYCNPPKYNCGNRATMGGMVWLENLTLAKRITAKQRRGR